MPNTIVVHNKVHNKVHNLLVHNKVHNLLVHNNNILINIVVHSN